MCFREAHRRLHGGVAERLVHRQRLGDRHGVDVEDDREKGADHDQYLVIPPLVPAGDAVHAAVEPLLQRLADFHGVAVCGVDEREGDGGELRPEVV